MRFREGMDAVPKSGGSHTPRATEHKDAASERLAGLVDGTRRAFGVENTDDLKVGDQTPEARLAVIKEQIAFANRCLVRIAAQPGMTDVQREFIRLGIVAKRDRLQEEFLTIAVDMPEVAVAQEDRRHTRCRKCGRLFETPKGVLRCCCREKAFSKAEPPKVAVSSERCPKCGRLISPPPGVFGCCCGKK